MSNIIKVPHTVKFMAEINLDTIPTDLLPAFIGLSESALQAMIQETTVHALKKLQFAEQANEGGGWAFVSIAE